MKDKIKKILSVVFCLLVVVGVGVGLYYGVSIKDNSVSAEELIERTTEDISDINIKLDNIDSTIQIIESSQSLTADEISKIKLNLQDQKETLKTYQSLIQDLQYEIEVLKDLQESTSVSVQSDLKAVITRLDHLETVVESISSAESFITRTHVLNDEEKSSSLTNGVITCKRYGNVVTIYITHINLGVNIPMHTSLNIATLPEEYRPSIDFSQSFVSMLSGSHFVECSSITGNLVLSAWANEITAEHDYITLVLTYVV